MTMTNNEAELREQVNKLLDFFTEPGQGEKYLKDLENDLVAIISDHTRKERSRTLNDITIWANQEMAKDHVALKQPTVEEE
jgi:predicted alpha/beta superfamily hydrolase